MYSLKKLGHCKLFYGSCFFAAALCLFSTTAWAEDCGEGEDSGDQSGQFVVEERNGQKVYVIKEAITVCGKVPRPSVLYVLQARTISYEWENLKKNFMPKILGSVTRSPF